MDGFLKPKAETADAAQEPSPRESGAVRVVEAPDVFDVTDTGLWDGRPSLGLIWVAYEGADPTNVIIRNEDTGKFVVGALYRRERFFPGPPFQLSSDAAAELGILAGRPTSIRVTALREEIVAPAAVEKPAKAPLEDEATPEAAAEPADIALPAGGDATPGVDPILAAAAAIEAADPQPEADTLEEVPTAPRLAPVVVAPVIPADAPRPTIEGPNAPLPRKIAPPIADVPGPDAPLLPAVAVSDPIENPIAPPSDKVSSLSRPFIQVGIFSVADNATQTAESLADAGVIPFVEEQRVGGRIFYRVVVGPASDAPERTALMSKVKGLGFEDAFFVAN